MMARQNARLPILTIERGAPFFLVSLGLREADSPPDLFRPTIRVPLRATQADSKRANAKK
jgi:hypothetical protein